MWESESVQWKYLQSKQFKSSSLFEKNVLKECHVSTFQLRSPEVECFHEILASETRHNENGEWKNQGDVDEI